MARCWLIADWSGRLPLTAAQFAKLRNLGAEFRAVARGAPRTISMPPPNMVAMSFDRLRQLEPDPLKALRNLVAEGATLYVRGSLAPGVCVSLMPFASASFAVANERNATSYRLSRHSMMPRVLANETADGQFSIAGADGLRQPIEPLLEARHIDGKERPAIFTAQCGAGAVVYDLNSDDEVPDSPIAVRLADPALRAQSIGALVAADRAAGRDPDHRPAFNLTVDDRPANLDFFNVTNLVRFLDRVQKRLPGAHVDFGWTPNQTYPSHRYVETLKQYAAGFVWHGFLRHIDHRTLSDPAGELAEGQRFVESISRRYGVRFQPVMSFPFERDTAECVDVLRRWGFRAKAQTVPALERPFGARPAYLHLSAPERLGEAGDFVVLHRKAIESLDRDWMLAQVALGLPLLAVAHPEDLRLKRFACGPWQTDSLPDLDRVLEFAAAKSLRPLSLEEISDEMAGA